ncbi:F-box/kelch-repeat protein At3g23880-like [Cicer arietinum]|uniref:F-box/kelch-repeat protein At3g23880-like n=1 Tax=Cicer arietinum TaxID=3827 RepID=UPI003CC52AAD
MLFKHFSSSTTTAPSNMAEHSNPTDLFPNDLITKILLLLNVKSILRFKCVSKSWNTLISDSIFIKLHLQLSPQNKHLLLIPFDPKNNQNSGIVSFPICRLLENKSVTLVNEPNMHMKDCSRVIGSCNGLVCLLGFSSTIGPQDIWIRLCNPITGFVSEKLGSFRQSRQHAFKRLRCTFCYHNSTYKVVVYCCKEVKVFSLSENSWRNIQKFPLFIFNYMVVFNDIPVNEGVNEGVYLRETYRQLLPPLGFDVVGPTIAVLMECLYFSYHFERSHFVMWKMTEFGVEESWTQFFKISYQNLQVNTFGWGVMYLRLFLFPLCFSENGDTLILASNKEKQAILYNLRDGTATRTIVTNNIKWYISKDYVESFVQ